ncbi:MAG TPA: hypothetical protein VK656_05140 [Candidatus Acidoferrum sp.]|nr:hypothetical protein [Candidatus Acidoferrum sp.]
MPPDPAATGAAAGSGKKDAGGDPPGLREQLRATRDAAAGMARAHIDLAKAEISEIMEEVQRVAILVGIAIGGLIFLGFLIPIGLVLFAGEWLFGSIGWGVLLVTELIVAVAVTAVVAALRVPPAIVNRAIGVSVLIGGILAIVLGLAFTNSIWRQIGDSAFGGIEYGVRPLVVGQAVGLVIGGVIGLAVAARAGRGARVAVGGLFAGAFVGDLIGALSAIRFGRGPGVALGIAVGLILWTALVARALYKHGIDTDSLKARFWPSQTIETTKETIEWVRERTPLGPQR